MQLEKEYDKINKVVETTLKNITDMIDVNTVIGKPLKTDGGEYIIPVSKVTVCLLVGGGEYGKLSIFKKGSDLPYSAGNGAVISVKPCGFLIGKKNDYRILSVAENSYEKLLDKAADFIAGLKNEKQQ